MVPRAGIEPATRGFSRLVAKISLCLYCNKQKIFEVCEKLCNRTMVCYMAIYCGQHSKLTTVLHHSKQPTVFVPQQHFSANRHTRRAVASHPLWRSRSPHRISGQCERQKVRGLCHGDDARNELPLRLLRRHHFGWQSTQPHGRLHVPSPLQAVWRGKRQYISGYATLPRVLEHASLHGRRD